MEALDEGRVQITSGEPEELGLPFLLILVLATFGAVVTAGIVVTVPVIARHSVAIGLFLGLGYAALASIIDLVMVYVAALSTDPLSQQQLLGSWYVPFVGWAAAAHTVLLITGSLTLPIGRRRRPRLSTPAKAGCSV